MNLAKKVRVPLWSVILAGFIIVFLAAISLTLSADTAENYRPTKDELFTKRGFIEDEYPLLRDFENQRSFAGQSVTYDYVDGDYYFAYLVHGSGLPIAQATCFRVDRMGRVYTVGEFPDPLDSYAGYPNVDPVTCKGIR